jgi:tricorn protease
MRRTDWLGAAASAGMAWAQPAFAQEPAEKPVLAEPSLSADGQLVAFASGGDIWEAPASGGVAHLIVTGPASEGRPLYSPDGKRLAFTSTRGGSANIFVLDLASGAVTRLTYGEASEELDGWSADGRWIYFASAATDVARLPDIFRVSADGGTPMTVSNERYLSEYQASPSPDGSSIAFMTRGISYQQWWRDGSSHIDQSEMWVKPTAGDGGYQRVLSDPSRHAWPMWEPSGAAIWYMSDSGGTENLWRLPTAGGAPRRVTTFADGRLLYPSMARDGSALVFERDFGIWRLDPRTGQAAQIPISLRGAPAAEPLRHAAVDRFTRLAVSPDGEKVAVIGHGELFAGPAKDGGPAKRITNSLGAEREVVWSPDSKRLLYVTERGLNHLLAEYDFATGRETMLTSAGHASVPAYAPDGKSAAYVLDDQQLRKLTFARPRIAQSDQLLYAGPINTDGASGPRPVWSPDGSYVAFPLVDRRSFVNVAVVPAARGEARPVSFLGNGQMSAIAWSPDGKYILFDTAQRSEDARIVRVDLTPHVPKLKEDQFADLFKDKPPGETKETAKSDKPKKEAPPPTVNPAQIAWAGLRERVTVLPLGLNASAPQISSDGKTLVFVASERGQDNLYTYNLDELADEPPVPRQLSSSARPKTDAGLTGDGKTVFYLDGGQIISTPLDTPKPKAVAVAADMDVDFAAEKRVVFDEAWDVLNRRFYDPGFHGKDWSALRAHYLPYAMGARTPDELRRVTNLMIGELNASHSGHNRPARGYGSLPGDRVGDLGLRFDRQAYEAGHGLVVSDVVALGPAAIGGVRAGDVLTSVDGEAIGPRTNLDSLLENKVGKKIVLGLGGRQVVVQPVSLATETGLLYRQWVNGRRALVDRVSGGRLGYVHLPDMSSDSLNQLYLDLDAENQSKAGVVIDVRNNNGGFINGYALDVFARRNYLTMTQRGYFPVPARQALGQRAFGKPTVLVTNESSLSDAEDFSEGYRNLGLGKIVGEPTAGWIIYTGPEPLIDGSTVRVPTVRIQGANGEDMEGNPRPVDVTVERPLGEGAAGHDAQLEAAVATLLGQIEGKQ